MSFTILYRSRKIKIIKTIPLPWAFGGVSAFVLGMVLLTHYSQHDPKQEFKERVAVTQTGLIQQREEMDKLRSETEQKLTGMILKLGEMQSELQRLNALGERLAIDSELQVEEFQFGQLPPVGGPTHDAVLPKVDSSQDVLTKIDELIAQLDYKSEQLEALESILMKHHINSESFISGRPIDSGWLSSYYGMRKDPFSGLPAMHKGVDFAGKEGSPVRATGAGMVTWAGQRFGYGNLVEVDHGNGYVTRYGHSKTIHVKTGDVVTKGQLIADMGSSGRSTGPHVHYEILKNGNQIDPLQFVYRKAVK